MLDAVKKCKAAGVTPISVGGAEKWPLHFYPVLLMMRILGKDGMASAYKGDNGGFAGPDAVKAWTMYKELCGLDPFPKGFHAQKYSDAAALFHDGKWILSTSRMSGSLCISLEKNTDTFVSLLSFFRQRRAWHWGLATWPILESGSFQLVEMAIDNINGKKADIQRPT